MNLDRTWTVVVVAVALACGCGEEAAPSVPQGTALSAENYCEAFFEPFCERQIGCNFALLNQATTIESCIEEAARRCSPELNTFLDSLSVERATFNVDNLEACREAVAATGCKELAAQFVPEPCEAIFEGTRNQGEDCFTDVECTGGTICASAGRCPGLCEVPNMPPDAFNCESIGCPEGRFCLDGRCSVELVEGEPCPNKDAACEGDLFCGKEAEDPQLLCRQPKPEGEPCFFRSHCRAGFSCQIAGAEVNDRTCELARAEGAPCFDTDECGAGLVCERNAGTCVKPRQEEEPCFGVFDCGEGLYCWDEFDPEPLVGICRENSKVGVGEGQPCNPLIDRCRLGLFCRSEEVGLGECTVLPDIGEACADFSSNLNEECRTGECVFTDGGLLCIEKGEGGALCSTGEECLSTSCREGVCAAFEDVFCTVDGGQ